MAIWEDARQRWREGRIGLVPLASPRGALALALFLVACILVIGFPLQQLAAWVITGEAPETSDFTLDLLLLSLALNVVALLAVPVLAVWISRPGPPGLVVERLRLTLGPQFGIHLAIGAGITVATMFALGALLWGLEEAGLYTAEESELVPQLQAVLTLPLIFIIPLIAAVTEEVFFRGILQPRVGLITSSLLFGVVHSGYGTVLQLVAPFVLGLLFGLLFERTRSLWAPIAGHFTFDLIQLSILYLLPESANGTTAGTWLPAT